VAEALLPFGIKGLGVLIKDTAEGAKDLRRTDRHNDLGVPVVHKLGQHECTVPQVRAWLRWVLQHSQSCVRAGVWFPEVPFSKDARV
jgi:hypothetical protein